MTRRRSPQHDYICRRCLCACNISGTRHEGGGSADFRACGKPPIPVLRSDFVKELAEDVASIRERHQRPAADR
ncbi:hypothetical protein [Mycobacteroides abscessus]|uniref:hypothetical protein n=1 Tax=Mycobacteroides abscessus TaxID=36809 RepID=UPI0009CDA63E|nr:hypothetical protein [Mycobacteroides abscessus]SKK36945.1 Uncharacterised protein [Mycobacteroides abscessus subsp. abscessus]